MKRELEGGWFQWIAMPLPAVLTIQSGINQLRYATLKGIMAAKKKEIRAVPAPAAGAARQRITSVYMPEKAKQTRMIDGSPAEAAKELVRALREDAQGVLDHDSRRRRTEGRRAQSRVVGSRGRRAAAGRACQDRAARRRGVGSRR